MTDFKKIENKEKYIIFRDEQIKKLDNLGKDWTEEKYKNAVLLSYWYRDYEKLLRKEDKFKRQNSHFKYNRGQILFVNFGYRIGHELGGNHYCVVISNKDSKFSGNVTVVPLKSYKKKFNKNFQVDLKNSLQKSIINNLMKSTSKLKNLKEKIETVAKAIEFILDNNSENNLIKDVFENLESEFEDDVDLLNLISNMSYFKEINDLFEYKKSVLQVDSYLHGKLDIIDKEIKFLNNKVDKAEKLNKRSIADVSQVTTISKSRIINPIRKNDTLSNIILDSCYLDLINNKIKDLFVFDK